MPVDWLTVSLAMSYGFPAIPVAALNLWICSIFVRERLWRKNKFLIFIALLAFADALIGVTYFIIMLLVFIGAFSGTLGDGIHDTLYCYIILFPMVLGTLLQASTTAAIAVERLFAVLCPVAYRLQGDRMTYIGSGVSIGVSIAVAIGGFGALVQADISTTCAQVTALIPQYSSLILFLRVALFFSGIALYITLLIVTIWRSSRVHLEGSSGMLEEQQTKRQAKIMRTVVVLVLVYACTTGTALCVTLALQHIDISQLTYVTLSQINVTFSCLNCLLNVFIFPLKFDELRAPMRAGIRRLLCRASAAVTTTRVETIQY